MAVLDRNAILQVDDLKREKVSVPEWGGDVYVRALTGDERDEYEVSMIEMRPGRGGRTEAIPKLQQIRANLVARTVCDELGNRLFKVEDVNELGAKSAAALDRLYEVAQRLSKLSEKDVQELAEDLPATPGDASPTA